MIHDTLDNFSLYTGLHPRFEAIAKWLKKTDLQKLRKGRHEILPHGEAFVNVQEVMPRLKTEVLAERHEKYIDIQLPLGGMEKMGWQPLGNFPQEVIFDKEHDVALACLPARHWLKVLPGEFVVFFPQDVHSPGLVMHCHQKAIIKVLR